MKKPGKGPNKEPPKLSTATTVLFSFLVTLVSCAIPVSYFSLNRENILGSTRLDAKTGAYLTSERVVRNPELWQYEEIRLKPLVQPYRESDERAPLNKIIADARGDRAISHVEFPSDELFAIRAEEPIYYAGAIAGTFIVEQSMQNVAKRTAWIALFSLGIGALLIGYLVLFPARRLKRAEQWQWWAANFDQLTGLRNRTSFAEIVSRQIYDAAREGTKVAVLFVDLDNFKSVNEAHGHPAGDRLLAMFATRLRENLRASDTVARLGGDEFAVTLCGMRDAQYASRVSANLLAALSLPFQLEEGQVAIRASIGISLYPEHANNAADLIKYADLAMYNVKRTSRNDVAMYQPESAGPHQRRYQLLQDGIIALEKNEFQVYFQPVVRASDGEVEYYEALSRWQHPVLGAISPAEFIPVFEDSGEIRNFGQWMLQRVAEYIRDWQQSGHNGVRVSINCSPREIVAPQFAKNFVDTVTECGIPVSAIRVEVTEGVLIQDAEAALTVMSELRDAGIEFFIDDFGTGYSSLTYLRRFPLSGLKIDRSFISVLERSAGDQAIVTAIINLAHDLGMPVTAEGVELQAQVDLLKKMKCDFLQGYFFSRPVPASELPMAVPAPRLRLAHSA